MKTTTILLSLLLAIGCNSQTKKVDESILKRKSQILLKEFNSESKILSADSDLLLDLNYDGVKDYIINYYGQSGTGIKNKVRIYIYDLKNNEYILDKRLSDLSNPTFYIVTPP